MTDDTRTDNGRGDASASLTGLLDSAEATHAQDPAGTATALTACAPGLPADAMGARAIRLAEHVCLAHLGDADRLARFAAAVPPSLAGHGATAAALQSLRWALAMVQAPSAGGPSAPPAEPLPEALRWRGLQNVVLALAAQGRWAEATTLLAADEEAARAHGSGAAGVAYAVSANNVATDLQTSGPRGDAQRDALMLQAAGIARRAWGHAGNWQHAERAEYRLALCHATAGQGAAALRHAQLCLAGCQAAGGEADAVEHFFAQEALARACMALGAPGQARAARGQMQALLAQIDEADGLRDWCAQVLAELPPG